MAKAKKVVEEPKEEVVEVVVEEEVVLNPITTDFKREDLNAFRDEVNKIIKKLS